MPQSSPRLGLDALDRPTLEAYFHAITEGGERAGEGVVPPVSPAAPNAEVAR